MTEHAIPADLFARHQTFTGLRALADFLETNPAVPVNGALEELAALRLAEWAHMLGFRGHFSTKSRRYSTTLGALRDARTLHAQREVSTGCLPFEDDTVLVVGRWHYLGQGTTRGDAALAAALTGRPLHSILGSPS